MPEFSSRLSASPVQLLVIQSTPFCNLDCSYCYLPARADTTRMALGTVAHIAARVIGDGWSSRDLTVIWHSGEPLVVPVDWYREAFEIFDAYCDEGQSVHHSFQTNGTLIDDRWLDLFRFHEIRLGVSVDGPERLHDNHRKRRDGRGSFAKVLEGLRALRAVEYPFHVITVVTESTLDRVEELFDFYEAEGIERVCFNMDEIEGPHDRSTLSSPSAAEKFGQFLSRAFERASAATPPIWVREFADARNLIEWTGVGAVRNLETEPLAILSVDTQGRACTFSPELLGTKSVAFADFRWVDLTSQGLIALLDHNGFKRARDEIYSGQNKCEKGCPWFRWCGGGAPANKFFENGSFDTTETLFCRLARQQKLKTALAYIDRLNHP